MQAWLRCNGTPEDLMKVWQGSDDPLQTKLMVSFYLADQQVQTHSRDAVDIEVQRRRDANKKK